MKTRIYVFTVIAFSMLLLFSSCAKEEKAGNTDFIANAGTIHNQLLDHYYENRTNANPDAEEMISEIIGLSSGQMINMGYDEETVLSAEKVLEERYSPKHLKSVMSTDFSIDLEELAQKLDETGLYSSGFVAEVEKVVEMVSDDVKIPAVSDYVNTKFAYLVFENKHDQQGQTLFTNVFNASYEYWTEDSDSNLKRLKLSDRSKVIINDGIGGLLGLVFGPAGSVITATVFSVGTNEEIK